MLDIVVFEEAGNQPIRELRPFLGRKLQCLGFNDLELIRHTNPLSWGRTTNHTRAGRHPREGTDAASIYPLAAVVYCGLHRLPEPRCRETHSLTRWRDVLERVEI